MPALSTIIDARGATLGAREFGQAARQVEQSAGRVDRNVKGVNRTISSLGGTSAQVRGSVVSLFGAFGLTLGVREAIKTIAGFEETMATLRGVTGIPSELDERFVRLTETARELGATTKFTAQEAADGLLFLARAGFDTEKQIAAIRPTLSLAAAGSLELGEAADFASNILSQFGLQAGETTRIVDTLVNTANSANTDVRQLAEAMKFVGPVAGALGIQVEETAAAIGVLGDAGIQSTMAGRGLRGILASLVDPSKEAKAALSALGISLEEVDPSRHNLIEIFQRFAAANLDAKSAVQIFSRENQAAALVLSQGVEKLGELTAANRENSGVAERNAQIINDTLAGSYRNLTSAVENLTLKAGDEGATGTIRGFVDQTTDGLRVLGGFNEELNGTAGRAEATAEALTGAAVAVGALLVAVTGPVGAGLVAIAALATAYVEVRGAILDADQAISERYKPTLVSLTEETGRAEAAQRAFFKALAGGDTLQAFNQLQARMLEVKGAISELTQQASVGPGTVSVGQLENLAPGARELFPGQETVEATRAIEVLSRELLGLQQDSDELEDKIAALGLTQTDGADAAREHAAALLDVGEASGSAGAAVSDLISGLEEEVRLLRASDEQREIGTEILRAQAEARQENRELTASEVDTIIRLTRARLAFEASLEREQRLREINDATIKSNLDALNEEIRAQQELQRVRESAYRTLESQQVGLEREIELVGVSRDEREKLAEVERARQAATAAGLEGEQVDIIAEQTARLVEQRQQAEQLRDIVEQVGETFAGAATAFLTGSASAKQAILGLIQSVSQLVIKTLLLRAIQAGIDAAFASSAPQQTDRVPIALSNSAMGNVFRGGDVVPFQSGGILRDPILFPLRGNKVGLAGEAGPEAIMPLARNARGELGVKTSGSGEQQQQQRRNVTVNVTINTPNADSFRRNERQFESRIQRIANGLS